MDISCRVLRPEDEAILERVNDDVFDNPINRDSARAFLNDSQHHIAVALHDDEVVGMATGVVYFHPDKQPELWLNEIGVAADFQRRGIGRRLLQLLFEVGREHGCREAWILTDRGNQRAMRFYESLAGVSEPEDAIMYSFNL